MVQMYRVSNFGAVKPSKVAQMLKVRIVLKNSYVMDTKSYYVVFGTSV